jgi:hypothetical protein
MVGITGDGASDVPALKQADAPPTAAQQMLPQLISS